MNTPSHSLLSPGVAAAVLFFTAFSSLDAADRTWRNEAGGTFSIASNWNGALIPGTGDTAGFGVNTSPIFQGFLYTVGFTANATNQALKIHDDLVIFDLNTRLYTTTAATGNVIGTVPGLQGSLTITDGTWDLAENSELVIGATAGATGILTVTIFGNLTDGNIIVGQAGAGAFNVTTGGVVNVDSVLIANAPGVTGVANLSGNSFWTTTGQVVVGVAGNGTFNMNGGQMNCASAVLGAASGSTGTATLVDGQWQLGTGSLIVGNDGDGQLNITFSGQVFNGNASLGELTSGGTAMVDGVDSQWISSGTFHVGNTGAGTLEVKNGGLVQVTGAAGGDIATLANSTGLARVNTGSRWTNTGPLRVGERGTGTMFVESGGLVENTNGFLGAFNGGVGDATVSGPNSRWINSGFLRVADQGTGSLVISQGGVVSDTSATIGLVANSIGTAIVKDSGSRWSHSTALGVGGSGDGFLNIAAGGIVENTVGIIGNSAGSFGKVLVEGTGSVWDNSDDLLIGFSGAARLEIAQGGRVDNVNGVVGSNPTANGDVFVRDQGSLWNNAGLLTVGDTSDKATLTVTGGGEVRSAGGIIGTNVVTPRFKLLVTVSDATSQWNNSADLIVGNVGVGELRVLNGALVQNKNASLARQDFSSGRATVDGQGSRWINDGLLRIGQEAGGELLISNGGTVQSLSGAVGSSSNGGIGKVTVKDAGSQWTILGELDLVTPLALVGENRLNVLPGGTVNVGTNLTIFNESTVNLLGGTINIGGVFQRFRNVNNFFNFIAGTLRFTGDVLLEDFRLTDILGPSHTIGELQHLAVVGTPTLEGLLRIDGGTFSVGSLPVGAPVDFNSGTFNLTSDNLVIGPAGLFGNTLSLSNRNVNVTNTTTIQPGARLQMQAGTFSAGTLINQGTIDFQNQSSQVSGGLLTNTGTIRGSGTILNSVQSNTVGQIQITSGQRLEFGGTVSNAGVISLVGGQVQFNGAVTNAASTGVISARDGILRFIGGLTNHGSLVVSFGTADVFGDVNNAATGRIVVSGNSYATFYDDLVNNGAVNVSTGSTAVYFGAVSGAGSFPGGGTNFFDGDLAPGNSPALVTFGGDVVYGTFANVQMELGGTARGAQHDAINVAGKLTFGGTMNVPLINGFQPQSGDVFNLFDFGTTTGTFDTVNLPVLNPGLLWSQANLYTAGEIQIGLDPAFTGRVWDGGGANNDWATDFNWDLNVEPLNNGNANLIFAGNVRLTPSVDTAWNVASITFDPTAGAFTVTGPQGITVGAGGITNNDADLQTITAQVTLAASESFTAVLGDLAFSNVSIGAQTLTIAGGNDVELDDVSGTGTVTKTGVGDLDIVGALGTGGITLNANEGTTNIGADQTLAALNIGPGAIVTIAAIGPAAEFAAVPEPSSAALLAVGILSLLRRHRRLSAR